jgi:ubiquinone/menaquinone biosynthesis C-methylase UbiE
MNIGKIHSEYNVDSFTKHDGTVLFFNFVRAIIRKVKGQAKVLDFGAGRGAYHHNQTSSTRDWLHDLRTSNAEVWAADIDEIVNTHPCSDHQVVLKLGESLPFEDNTFDVIVVDFVFEHLDYPSEISKELVRITKQGGWICSRTPNKWGYVALASRVIPNSLHKKFLSKAQPKREKEDVFPTVYHLNSPRDVRKHFSGCNVQWYYHCGDPAYYFGSAILYRFLLIMHRFLPPKLSPSICFFIQKK